MASNYPVNDGDATADKDGDELDMHSMPSYGKDDECFSEDNSYEINDFVVKNDEFEDEEFFLPRHPYHLWLEQTYPDRGEQLLDNYRRDRYDRVYFEHPLNSQIYIYDQFEEKWKEYKEAKIDFDQLKKLGQVSTENQNTFYRFVKGVCEDYEGQPNSNQKFKGFSGNYTNAYCNDQDMTEASGGDQDKETLLQRKRKTSVKNEMDEEPIREEKSNPEIKKKRSTIDESEKNTHEEITSKEVLDKHKSKEKTVENPDEPPFCEDKLTPPTRESETKRLNLNQLPGYKMLNTSTAHTTVLSKNKLQNNQDGESKEMIPFRNIKLREPRLVIPTVVRKTACVKTDTNKSIRKTKDNKPFKHHKKHGQTKHTFDDSSEIKKSISFQCRFCEKEFAASRYLEKHVNVRHKQTQNKVNSDVEEEQNTHKMTNEEKDEITSKLTNNENVSISNQIQSKLDAGMTDAINLSCASEAEADKLRHKQEKVKHFWDDEIISTESVNNEQIGVEKLLNNTKLLAELTERIVTSSVVELRSFIETFECSEEQDVLISSFYTLLLKYFSSSLVIAPIMSTKIASSTEVYQIFEQYLNKQNVINLKLYEKNANPETILRSSTVYLLLTLQKLIDTDKINNTSWIKTFIDSHPERITMDTVLSYNKELEDDGLIEEIFNVVSKTPTPLNFSGKCL